MTVTWAPPLSSILRRRLVRLRWRLIARIVSRLGRRGIWLLGGRWLAIVAPRVVVPLWRGRLAIPLWRGRLAVPLWRERLAVPLWGGRLAIPLWRVGVLGRGVSVGIRLVA